MKDPLPGRRSAGMPPRRCPYGRPGPPYGGLGAAVDARDASRVVRASAHPPGIDQRVVMVRTRWQDTDDPPPRPLCGPADVAELLHGMRSRLTEQAVAVLVDDDMVPLGVVPLGEGLKNQTSSAMSTLGQAILVTGATGVVHVHNHPQLPVRPGLPWQASVDLPSPPDRAAWANMAQALPVVGARLVDGIVIGGDGGVASGLEEQEMGGDHVRRHGPGAVVDMMIGRMRPEGGR